MKSIANSTMQLRVRSDKEWERIVMAEVLVPEVPNVFGDYWTREAVREAAYCFARQGYGIDVEHDNVDVSSGVTVVESFIARAGDPEFIEGAWVVAMYIEDDEIWQAVLDGKINGYSYEALISWLAAVLEVEDDGIRSGETEPDVNDGHTHYFMVLVGEDNRPVAGGTSDTNGHFHGISSHTVTDESAGHVHRFNLVVGKDGK